MFHLCHTGLAFGDENTPCPNERTRSSSRQRYASMSEDKRAALNAKRRENYHRKKAEVLAASGINVTILLWRTCTKGILMLLTVFVMSRCFTRGCRAVTDSAIWTVGGIFDPR